LLTTSRTRLNVQGEHLFPVGGMTAPDPLTVRRWQTLRPPDIEAEAANYSAVRLFCQSAARVRPGFRLERENVLDVARICRQVEGLPLGSSWPRPGWRRSACRRSPPRSSTASTSWPRSSAACRTGSAAFAPCSTRRGNC
jgi:hypothetical protein